MSPRTTATNALLAVALCGLAHTAAAAIWGYIDEQGNTHVASEKLDDRYELFFKGRSSADLADDHRAGDVASSQAFRRTPVYLRFVDDPSVKRLEPLILQHARAQGIDPALVKAVIAVESAFRADAVSSKGALGLMQVIPDTAARYGVVGDKNRSVSDKLFDPGINLRVGTRYLRDLLALFANDVALALAAYNAGEQAVQRYDNAVPRLPRRVNSSSSCSSSTRCIDHRRRRRSRSASRCPRVSRLHDVRRHLFLASHRADAGRTSSPSTPTHKFRYVRLDSASR